MTITGKSFFTSILVLCWTITAVAMAESPRKQFEHINVFDSGSDGYHSYRIPAVVASPDGSILVFAEGRKTNCSDPGGDTEIDLVLKRSIDDGKTWSPMQIVERLGNGKSSANPAPVVDRDTKNIWLLYMRCEPEKNIRRARPGTRDNEIYARSSDDGGRTWSEPIDLTEITRDMKDPLWRTTVIGPGGVIQDAKGRLIAAAWRNAPFNPFTIFSDDHGRTWQRGEIVPEIEGAENQVLELSDGRLLMDIRQSSRQPHRWLSESRDGGRTWSKPRAGVTVTPVACAIEYFTQQNAKTDRDLILWTGPKGPKRRNLVLRISRDDGLTFPEERLLYAGKAAYSDMTVLKDNSIAVLWERDNYKHITFTRVEEVDLNISTE